jgi:N-acyl-D-aspartate/D-glutamate deacylase
MRMKNNSLYFFMTSVSLLVLSASLITRAQGFDLVIANGRLVDPESNVDGVRHIGLTAGKIAAISANPLAGARTIDASGLVVAPGFIDLHSHGQLPDNYRLQSRDGVTTALELEVGTSDVDRWYDERKAGRLINYGVSIGHIQVRMAVMHDPGSFLPVGDGAHKPATAAENAEMIRRIELGLRRGAVGIGAGFPYTPAATAAELTDVFKTAARARASIHVHARRGVAGATEVLDLARATRAPLHIVHINSMALADTVRVLGMIEAARAENLDVTTEAYPYDAGMTEIQSANLDEYVNATDERMSVLEWPRTGERLTRETFGKYRTTGGPVVIHTNTEPMVATAVTSQLTMIASDAYWENGTGHPRTSGTYSRVLGRYVRDVGALTLMNAIRKMTLMPAQRLESHVPSMRQKGRIKVGADADITIFDAARVIDRSTYREPMLAPVGIQYVFVNGVAVISNGQPVDGVAPGRAVRAPMQ